MNRTQVKDFIIATVFILPIMSTAIFGVMFLQSIEQNPFIEPQTIPATQGRVIESESGLDIESGGVNLGPDMYELHIRTTNKDNAVSLAIGFAAALRWDEIEAEESEAAK